MFRKLITFILVLVLACFSKIALTQTTDLSQFRSKVVSTQIDSIRLDTLSILPSSIIINELDSSYYIYNFQNGFLVWKKKPLKDSVLITYRVFAFDFAKIYFHKNPLLIQQDYAVSPYQYDGNEANKNQPFIDFGSLDYGGSFARNLSFGNSQDVVLNSQFNMQLDGNLGDSIILTGAITDNNIPFQPEGNTQQIQEFDRVFLQLKRRNTSLIIGDHDIKRPLSHFMNFYKRVQGAYSATSVKTSKNGELKIGGGASLAKGKFVRNTIVALEGNQGPYKLAGPNGEQFFIVLAGTERVYIDGIQMQRGENQDYTVDYNTAEVSFMPRRIITKDLRIVVEFEFSDRNYLNSFVYLNTEWQVNRKLHFRFNTYSNQDAKNQPIQQSLDSLQKRFLAGIGDSIQQALYTSARLEDSFSVTKILYRKTDTSVNGIFYSNIYVYNTNPDSAKYQLSFSYVGPNTGNYKQTISSANGRVYEWQAPVNGIKQGDYEPVILLVTPKRQQLFTLGSTYKIDNNKTLLTEIGLSNSDPNLFSRIHNPNHLGLATKIMYDEVRNLTSNHHWTLNTKVNYEFVQSKFRPIERFRNVEFLRDWNVINNTNFEDEHLANAAITIAKKQSLTATYQFDYYKRGADFIGQQHTMQGIVQKETYRFMMRANTLLQKSATTQSIFARPNFEFEKRIKRLHNMVIGTKSFAEHNLLRDAKSDSLLKNAFAFNVGNIYIKSNATAKNSMAFEYTWREDKAAQNNEMQRATLGHTFSYNANVSSWKNQDLRITSAYRILKISDTNLTGFKPDESLLGRTEYNLTALKGLIGANLLYEFGSGQELKREFAYIEVPVGQGVFVWRDYNLDNIQQLNEFEIAIFQDEKKFIRVLTPTNQYVKAKYSIYNQTLSINPKAILNQTTLKGFKKFISIFYFQSAIQLNNRFVGSQGISQYNPLAHLGNDSLLLNNNSSVINSILLNRFSNVWGLDYIQSIVSGKTLLTYGVDARRNADHQFRARVNLTKKITLTNTLKYGGRSNESKFLENKNFDVNQKLIEPGIIWLLLKNQLRIQANYKFDTRENKKAFGGEVARQNSMNLLMKYNTVGSGSFNVSTTYSSIAFNGNANSAVAYSMLDGLVNGKNWLWQISFEKRLARNIEMALEYEGRKSGSNAIIQTGRASLRAVF